MLEKNITYVIITYRKSKSFLYFLKWVIFLKIAIFSEIYLPYLSGISSFISVLRKSLISLGHEVLVVTSSTDVSSTTFKEGILCCPAKSANNKYGMSLKNPNDQTMLKKILEFNPNVIHINTDTAMGKLGLAIAHRLGLPTVYSIQDYYEDRFFYESSKIKLKIGTMVEKSRLLDMVDNCDVITASSGRAHEYLASSGRKDKQVKIIPSDTDISRFDYQNTSPERIQKLREKYNISPDTTLAIYAGRLDTDKSVEYLLQEWAQFIRHDDNMHLMIVGDGTESASLKDWTKYLKIENQVTFTGEVPHSLMPEYYAASNVYVSAATTGLMSMSVLEAIACGLPVLLKRDKYTQEIVKEGVNGFTYERATEFGDRMKQLSSLDVDGKRIIKNVVRRSRNDIPCDNMAKQFISAYETAIKKKAKH